MIRWKIQQSDTSRALFATSSAPIQSGVSRSAGASRPQPIPDVLQLPLQRGPLELLHHALAQKRHVGAAIGLALEQFQTIHLPLGDPITPGQREPSFNRSQIVLQTCRKPDQRVNATLGDLGPPYSYIVTPAARAPW
jgi:hypothetical protein